jgi:hypothetical protein
MTSVGPPVPAIWITFRSLSHTCPPLTDYKPIAKRELVAIRTGRARRVPEFALKRWIAQQVHAEGGDLWHDTQPDTRPSSAKETTRRP